MICNLGTCITGAATHCSGVNMMSWHLRREPGAGPTTGALKDVCFPLTCKLRCTNCKKPDEQTGSAIHPGSLTLVRNSWTCIPCW
jgi:hypothetical protein